MRAVLLSTFLAVLVALISISLAMPRQILAAAPNTTNFSENHQLYDTGTDIAALQQFLNTHGFLVALSGPGAPGEETGFFGILTYQALIKFQAAHGLPATGFFGPLTRALLNGSDTTQTAPTTSTLTQTQISAILSLLQSFGADQATVNNVQAALGTPGTTHATTTAAAPPIYTTPPPTPAIGQPWHAPSGGGGGGGDSTPPVITGTPSNITAEATSGSGAAVTYANPTATDNVDGTVSVSCSPASGSTFALGATTVTCSATDKAGNSSSSTFTVTVQDTTAPTISGTPSNVTAEASGGSGAAVTYTTPTATDNVDETVSVSCSPASGSTFAIGNTTVTCSATDSHGNAGTSNFHIIVGDTTGPILALPGDTTAEATGPSGATVNFTATASDVVNGSEPVSCAPASGSTFAIGTTAVHCSASDASSNTTSGSFNVIVRDTTAPTVSMTAPSSGATVGGTAVTLTATASDNVAVANVQFKVGSANIGSAVTSSPYTTSWNSTGVSDGSHTLYAVAEDTSGNYATSSISVTVDNTAPVISSIATTSVNNVSATVTWATNEAANSKVVYGTTASYGSATSSAILVTSHSIGVIGLTASTTYHFAVVSTDAAGNAATSSDKTFITQTGLLGVNLDGATRYSYTFPTSADFAYLQSKGITFVKLIINWENLQSTLGNTSLNATYLAAIKTAIAAAHAHNIGVIVYLYNNSHYVSTGWGTTYTTGGNGGVTASGVSVFGDGTLTTADFVDLWTALATSLVGTPGLIGYGLDNEPQGIIGTNLFSFPNYFGQGAGGWFKDNSGVVTQLAAGTNPLGSVYSPAWSLTSGSGWAQLLQTVTLANVPYTISAYAKISSGTGTLGLYIGDFGTDETVTTSWQRFSYTATPTAGADLTGVASDVSTAQTIQIADVQLELGSSPTSYQPSVWMPIAQAAVTAIRAIDATTPIYIEGLDYSSACRWPESNFEMQTMTGGNLIFDVHQYFDGSVSQCGDGADYSGTYSSYGITTSAGVQEVTPFVNWLSSTAQSGYVGEYAIPDNSKGDQAQWLTLQNLFLQSLIQNNIPSSMWFYGSNGIQSSNILNVATSTTANGGNDDPRLIQMLQQY